MVSQEDIEFKAKQREPLLSGEEKLAEEGQKSKEQLKGTALKFGWIKGVLVSSIDWNLIIFSSDY